MMLPMMFLRQPRTFLEDLEDRLQKSLAKIVAPTAGDLELNGLLTAAAWVLGGVGVVTLGLLAGRELRGRYKLKRRTPYDYYAHSGDRSPDLDYSVGI
ncbi:MAG: hypothetical protein ACRYF4_14270 [Janthinobacterium lividum]